MPNNVLDKEEEEEEIDDDLSPFDHKNKHRKDYYEDFDDAFEIDDDDNDEDKEKK